MPMLRSMGGVNTNVEVEGWCHKGPDRMEDERGMSQ